MTQFARLRLNVEHLETRDLPSSLTQPVDTANQPTLPGGWAQWSNDGSTVFSTIAGQGTGAIGEVVSTGSSNTAGLAWETQSVSGNTSVSAGVDVTSLIPTFVFAGGSNLGTATPSYIAAEVTRGATVTVVQVTNGVSTTLATLSSSPSAYFSGNWAQVSLIPSGSSVAVQLMREDTNQYLNAQGNWQSTATNALVVSTTLAGAAGDVGIGRAAAYSGSVDLNDFTVDLPPVPPPPSVPPPPAAVVSQTFDTTAIGAIPIGWQTWSSNAAGSAGVSSAVSLSPPNSYALSGASNSTVLAWSTASLPAAVSAAVDVDVTSLIPAELIVDGANLNSSAPTYDAVTISRGLEASLVQVVNGTTTTLATIASPPSDYLSGQWVQVELTAQGSDLLASIYRTDKDQWLTSSGKWSSTQSYAFNIQNATSLAAGVTGIGRSASYSGTTYFDNFTAGAVGSLGSAVTVTSPTVTSPPTTTLSPPVTISADPASAVAYSAVPSSDTLFGPNGPSYLDVEQGQLGDCWLVASLAEVAAQDPQAITQMFKYDGTTVENGVSVGVYTVRFFNSNDVAKYVTVDTELPDGGNWYDHPLNGVLWVALAEKAYAVANGLGYVTTSDAGSNSYEALETGYPTWALQAITGNAGSSSFIYPSQIASSWSSGSFIVLPTVTPSSSYLVANHDYAVVGYNASTGLFTLLNPWGGSTSSDLCPQDTQVYGLFTATASFVSANFSGQTVAAEAAASRNAFQPIAGLLGATVTAGASTVRDEGSNSLPPYLQASSGLDQSLVPESLIVPSQSHQHHRETFDGDDELMTSSGVFVG